MGRVVGGKGERDEGGEEERKGERGREGRGGGQCALKTSMQLGEEERGGCEMGGWREKGRGKECNNHMRNDTPSDTHPSHLTPLTPYTPHRFVVQECGRVVEQRDEMERRVETLEQTITASQQQTFEVSV